MALKLRWSPEAYKDIEMIVNYISRDSENYAKSVVKSVLEKTKDLKLFPKSGRIVPELDNENVREVFVFQYRIIYEIKKQTDILILAIIHGRREFRSNK